MPFAAVAKCLTKEEKDIQGKASGKFLNWQTVQDVGSRCGIVAVVHHHPYRCPLCSPVMPTACLWNATGKVLC